VVIGQDTGCGDPIFASQEHSHPVFSAMHGQGSWNPKLVAQSLDVLRQCLNVFQRFSTGRSSRVELDANPPGSKDQIQFLEDIRSLTNGDQEVLGFWAVQIELDLDAFSWPT
jgi:hypothetical protein